MKELPMTVRRSLELLGLCLLGLVVVVGKGVIMPLLMAFFICILLLPVYRFFKRLHLPEFLAIILSIVLAFLIVGGIGLFFSMQMGTLLDDFPEIQKNVNAHFQKISGWINEKTHFSTQQQLKVINEQGNKLLNNAGQFMQGAAGSVSSVFVFVALLPIYIFLMLYYKNLLLRFIFLWFNKDSHPQVESALREVQVIIKSYLIGLLIQVTYMTILLGGILLLLGNKHALLIGIIFAILNLIPYVGALIGNLIGVLLTLTSSQDPVQVLVVLLVIAGVQFLDNNILMPRIVGSKVKLNALVSIVGVVIGGALAGVAGMFLSLPVMAILKIVFDRTDNFRHWGVLLGEENPNLSPMNHNALRMRKKGIPNKTEVEEEGGTKKPKGSGA